MPRVEDSTGFNVSSTGCKHRVLFFGAGGYLVLCSECGQVWEKKNTEYLSIVEQSSSDTSALGPEDKRVDQSLIDKDVLSALASLINSPR
jgi:hypothetical protein